MQGSKCKVQGATIEVVDRGALERDLGELRDLVAARDREGAVAQLKAMAGRY